MDRVNFKMKKKKDAKIPQMPVPIQRQQTKSTQGGNPFSRQKTSAVVDAEYIEQKKAYEDAKREQKEMIRSPYKRPIDEKSQDKALLRRIRRKTFKAMLMNEDDETPEEDSFI